MKKAVINYQKTTGIAREEQIYENRIYRMWKYGTSNDHLNFDTESRKSTGIDRIQSTRRKNSETKR